MKDPARIDKKDTAGSGDKYFIFIFRVKDKNMVLIYTIHRLLFKQGPPSRSGKTGTSAG